MSRIDKRPHMGGRFEKTSFIFARLKFVTKILRTRRRVLGAGCDDTFGGGVMRQRGKELTVDDLDLVSIEDKYKCARTNWKFACLANDMSESPVQNALALDETHYANFETKRKFLKIFSLLRFFMEWLLSKCHPGSRRIMHRL